MDVIVNPHYTAGGAVLYAHRLVSPQHMRIYEELFQPGAPYDVESHWSRQFEYPWVLLTGDFQPGQWVLDAAGGDAPLQSVLRAGGLQVVNVDRDPGLLPIRPQQIIRLAGDLRRLHLVDGVFDRVVCCSVLEHTEDHEQILSELWRVLRPGGRLLVTFDVAPSVRYNHTIDLAQAERILSSFHLSLPDELEDTLSHEFEELEPQEGEPPTVTIKALCFWADKWPETLVGE